MSFGIPMALWWLAAGIPVVALYILKVRQRRVPVPTLLFWQQVFEEKQPRSIWRKLRHLLSLLAQLLLLCLLALALSQPLLPWQAFKPRQIVMVIDNSASMQAGVQGETRLDQARQEARDIVSGMRFFDSLAVLTAGEDVAVACGLTGHQRTLREKIDAIEPTRGRTRLSEAISVARKLLDGKDNKLILLVTDQPAPTDDVTLVPITGSTDNAAVTRLAVRRSLIDPLGYEILAHVTNFGEGPIETRFELSLADNILDVYPLKLEPGETWIHVFEKTSAEGGKLVGQINRNDALPLDNSATATLPKRRAHRITLHAGQNIFIQRVLEAIPLVQLVEDGSLHVYLNEAPETQTGNAIVIDPQNATELWDLGAELESPLVTEQDKTSPLMAHVRLDNVLMPAARQIKPKHEAAVLAEALTGDPIYLAFERDGQKTLVLTADLDQSDLPLRTAFPIMMTNALNWFANEGGELQIASDTIDLAESDLKQPEDFEQVTQRIASAGLTGRPMWFYLLLAALALCATEWWLYQRRHLR